MNGIELQLTKDIIRDKSFNSVDKAIKIIKAFGSQDRFIVLGAKDSSGTAIFNNNLSKSIKVNASNIHVSSNAPAKAQLGG